MLKTNPNAAALLERLEQARVLEPPHRQPDRGPAGVQRLDPLLDKRRRLQRLEIPYKEVRVGPVAGVVVEVDVDGLAALPVGEAAAPAVEIVLPVIIPGHYSSPRPIRVAGVSRCRQGLKAAAKSSDHRVGDELLAFPVPHQAEQCPGLPRRDGQRRTEPAPPETRVVNVIGDGSESLGQCSYSFFQPTDAL
ncbi:MAG: hypothetical protein CMJ58_24385 [Planctomycetaceae bacterium]|nr:hypothetical protein [Planctomycetaceae bacterium]